MVEIGGFHERFLGANRNEIALRKSIEIGENECDDWLVAESPNSYWPGASNFEYCSGAIDIGGFHAFNNHESNSSELGLSSCSSEDADFTTSVANTFMQECEYPASSSMQSLPLSMNLLAERLAMRVSTDLPDNSMLELVGGHNFPSESMALIENCDIISKHSANYDQWSWPEKVAAEDVERNWPKRKIVYQDINQEVRCLRKRSFAMERSVSNFPETCIAEEMGIPIVINSPTVGSSDITSTKINSDSDLSSSEDVKVHSDLSALITAGPALNTTFKPRARRGSATDPQSVYARNRRGKINERLKLLQNLVPNGTKVDISTMLEQAIQYVKFMQLQIKLLSSDQHWMYTPIAFNGMDFGDFEPRI